jgi:hypothetical protein
MRLRALVVIGLLTLASIAATVHGAGAASSGPDLGPNVHIFSPSMDQASIQSQLDSIASVQVSNQFGARRDAILFMPGVYGSGSNPLNFQVGYYTTVAGLGQSPTDVVINGSAFVRNQCNASGCFALENFWRSLSNLQINVTTPNFGCYFGEFWPVSQAAPMRRVLVNGYASLMDYCTGPSYASGGFIADSVFTDSITSGSQQQWLTRNSTIGNWSNGVWNQVFSGVVGAPAQCFPARQSCGGPYTTLDTNPVTREAPYLYVDAAGGYNVFVPAVQHDTRGPSWTNGPTPGASIPIGRFFVASPADSGAQINAELHRGQSLILTPGVYHLDQPIEVTRPDTVVLGLGMPTLVPQQGAPAMNIHPDRGVIVSGVIFDAGPQGSQALLEVGSGHTEGSNASDPSALYDVFFRIGGAAAGKVGTALVVNSNDAILDDIWAWRADHGSGVGWTSNTADTGVIVNGDNVTAYGLFVEHFQKTEVIWNGNNGRDVFFQNELPYDPPDQASWMASPTKDGYPAFQVAPNVTTFNGYGMGSYVVFIQTTATLYDAEAFQSPTSPGVQFHDLLTVWIAGSGGDLSVINGVGGPDTSTSPGVVVPVDVVSYP